MCMECRQHPCHPRCPNADEPREVCKCDKCTTLILEGEYMYKVFEYNICEDCMIAFSTKAEID